MAQQQEQSATRYFCRQGNHQVDRHVDRHCARGSLLGILRAAVLRAHDRQMGCRIRSVLVHFHLERRWQRELRLQASQRAVLRKLAHFRWRLERNSRPREQLMERLMERLKAARCRLEHFHWELARSSGLKVQQSQKLVRQKGQQRVQQS